MHHQVEHDMEPRFMYWSKGRVCRAAFVRRRVWGIPCYSYTIILRDRILLGKNQASTFWVVFTRSRDSTRSEPRHFSVWILKMDDVGVSQNARPLMTLGKCSHEQGHSGILHIRGLGTVVLRISHLASFL